MTVTKAQLEAWRAQRAKQQASPEFTPDGSAYGQVKSSIAAQREREIREAERAMNDAKRDMRREYELARLRGSTKVSFNRNNQEIKP